MKVKKLTLQDSAYPSALRDIPSPPKELYYLGMGPSEWLKHPRVAIVGSRGITPYGRAVTEQFAGQLAERGIAIVSGLALGVDAVAHAAALKAGGQHIAVLANGLDQIYPATNTMLAKQLLTQGGAIISEYPEGTPSLKQNFVARNRIVAGLSNALLITEATEKSGTLHTARFALEQGRDVLVVPGNITSPQSAGCNNLIRAGATPVTCIDDILFALGTRNLITTTYVHKGDNPDEQAILDLLYSGVSDAHELLQNSELRPELFTQALTMLELSGKIHPLGNNHWAPS
ncbi:MAG: DNA-processing protein DprA [Candidatus Saccharimonadales bacterium]